MNEDDKKNSEAYATRPYRRRGDNRASHLGKEPTNPDFPISGFSKTISWIGVITIPIATIVSVYNLMLSKIQSIVSEVTKIQEFRIGSLENDLKEIKKDVKELEKREH